MRNQSGIVSYERKVGFMGAWGTAVFSDDLAMDVRSEYNFLVSINKENSDIEKLLMDYYSDILNCNDPDEDVFWFALSLSEWKKGRCSANEAK